MESEGFADDVVKDVKDMFCLPAGLNFSQLPHNTQTDLVSKYINSLVPAAINTKSPSEQLVPNGNVRYILLLLSIYLS